HVLVRSRAADASIADALGPRPRPAVSGGRPLGGRCGRVVLADGGGPGKSYVAAAVGREMQRRGAAIEVIVPAPLFRQWHETLADFEVSARVITHDSLLSDPFTPCADGFRFIVVDEAHAFRNSRTQRYDALARRALGWS